MYNTPDALTPYIPQLSTLFKYFNPSQAVVDGLFLHHKIRFTQPRALNDPMEFNPEIRFDDDTYVYDRYLFDGNVFPSEYDWSNLNIIEKNINRYGVLSLTEDPNNFHMWSHYADGHRGFVVEFYVGDKKAPSLRMNEKLSLPVYRVQYEDDYFINVDQILRTNGGEIPFEVLRDQMFLRKTRHWEYEKEFRVI